MKADPSSPRLLIVSHPAVLPVNQLVYSELARRGYRVDLVVPARWRHEYNPARFDSAALPELVGRYHRRRVLLEGRPQRHLYLANPLAELRRQRPDLVFCEQEPFSVAAAQWGLAAQALRIPYGVQMAENLDRLLPWPARVLRHLVLPRASFVAARSATAATLAVAWGARGDVRLIPHHVPAWPAPSRRDRDHDGFTVGFAGRLVDEKGLDTLVAAVRRLGPGTELLIAGDGPLRSWLESVDLGEAGLRLVRGTDHAEMGRLYAEMDVLVLPSRTTPSWAEQFGRVLVEAMWCATPVVGSDSGEIPWVIETTGGGETFPEGDARALADCLASLRADRPRRERLARQGQERVAAMFSVEAVADQFEQVLHRRAGWRRRAEPDKPRVALVAHGVHDRGGMERACAELIRHGADDFDFIVVSADLAPELRDRVSQWIRVGVPARPIPVKFSLFWWRAGRVLRDIDADLVHSVGAVVPNRVDLASIHFCHAGFAASSGRLALRDASLLRRVNSAVARSQALLAERWSYRRTRTRVFGAVSEGVAEELARHYPAVPCAITANGVDLSRFRPDAGARLALRQALGTESTTTVALFVGGDWDRKGLDIAIVAVGLARAMGNDIDLWVVGEGDRRRLEHCAVEHGVASSVRFHGARDDTERFYQAADLFVLPSAYEAFSLASLEAAACGLPVVMPAIPGAQEIVGANEGGLYVHRSAPSVAAALARLASDPGLRCALGAAARQRVQAYTWESSAASVTDLYMRLLAKDWPTEVNEMDVGPSLQTR